MENYSMWISPSGQKYYIEPFTHEIWIEDNLNNPEVKPLLTPQWKALVKKGNTQSVAGAMYVSAILPKNGWIRVEGGGPASEQVTIDGPVDEMTTIESFIESLPDRFREIGVKLFRGIEEFGALWTTKENVIDDGLQRLFHKMRMGIIEKKSMAIDLQLLEDELDEWGFQQEDHGRIPVREPTNRFKKDEKESKITHSCGHCGAPIDKEGKIYPIPKNWNPDKYPNEWCQDCGNEYYQREIWGYTEEDNYY